MSMVAFRTNNILTVKGVFTCDLHEVDALFEKRPVSAREFAECVRSDIYTTYSAIPTRFASLEQWPTMTNLLCWRCNRGFKTRPKPIALDPERVHGRTEWNTCGNFCTFNCAVAHIRTKLPVNQRLDAEKNTCMIASIFESRTILRIQPSPDETQMKQYCGEHGMTEKQYGDAIEKLNADYDMPNYKPGCYNEHK